MEVRRFLAVSAVALAAFIALAAEEPKMLTLTEARSQIGAAAADAKTMGKVMSQLSAGDQKKFLALVNAAIEKLPGSPEDRTQKFVDANRAALLNAQKGNLPALVTEMFATVDVASLPAIVETFSQELFNRSADPDRTYVDAEYAKIAKEVVNQVETRTSEDKACGARTTFAILMFVNGSNGSKEVEKQLVEGIANAETREIASREWMPAALGETQKKTYDPILGYVGQLQVPGTETAAPVEMSLALPETLRQETLLADLAESLAESTQTDGEEGDGSSASEKDKGGASSSKGGGKETSSKGTGSAFQNVDAQATSGKSSVVAGGDAIMGGADQPRSTDPTKPWSPTPEPTPYGNQTL